MSAERLEYLNKIIDDTICYDTIEMLSEKALMSEYKNCKSVDVNISNLKEVLKNNSIDTDIINKIVAEYISSLIPPGTKGVIKGNKFNKIIQNEILSYALDKEIYDIQFEKKCEKCETSEIPDWYIHNKINNKIIIGMNQLDLWSGGHQLNRGFKYLIDCKNEENVQIVCVVCNHIKLKSNRSKTFKLFDKCLEKGTLSYIKSLRTNIMNFL